MTDHELITRLEKRVQTERKLLALILHDLREVECRRLYSELGYKSLFDFATKHLKYSEAEAYARMNAMRVVSELPAIEAKIESGELTITHMVHAQKLFNREDYSQTQKIEVFEKIAGKSAREAERITLSLSSEPEALKPDRIKPVTEQLTELKFLVNNETLAKLEQLRNLLAHAKPNATLGELLDHALTRAIEIHKARAPRKRRDMLNQAHHACTNCGSKHALEIDHIHPKAKGGSDDPTNLRVLCRACNQRAALNAYGQGKMDRFINRWAHWKDRRSFTLCPRARRGFEVSGR